MSNLKEFDALLNYGKEDVEWCQMLEQRLKAEGVRVWFDEGESLVENSHSHMNELVDDSRKIIAVWTQSYFRTKSAWALAERFKQRHADVLNQERLLIPLLLKECNISPKFKDLLYIDFRNDEDFEIRLRELIQALDLSHAEPSLEFGREEIRGHEPNSSRRGFINNFKGKSFEDEVATLYRLFGFDVKQDVNLSGLQIDMTIEREIGGFPTQAIVECKDTRITSKERDQVLAQQNVVQKKLPMYRWAVVSSHGFAAETRTALEEAGIYCITYSDLLRKMVPLDTQGLFILKGKDRNHEPTRNDTK